MFQKNSSFWIIKNKIFCIIFLAIFNLSLPIASASPAPPAKEWNRFLYAEHVVLVEAISDKSPKFKILEFYKGTDLEDVIVINLDSTDKFNLGDKFIAFLAPRPKESLNTSQKTDPKKTEFNNPLVPQGGAYDLLWYNSLMMGGGPSFKAVTEKNPEEPDLMHFLVKMSKAKDDATKYHLIKTELDKNSQVVKRLPLLFVSNRASFVGYIFDPMSPQTWLPTEGSEIPKTLSHAANKYLRKHLSNLDQDQRLMSWLVQLMVHNHDAATKTFLMAIIKNQPISSAIFVTETLLKFDFQNDTQKKEIILETLILRAQEALDLIKKFDEKNPENQLLFYQETQKNQVQHRLLDTIANLALQLNVKDDVVKTIIETWAQKSPLNREATNAIKRLSQ